MISGTNPELDINDVIDQMVADWIEVDKPEVEEWTKEGWRLAEEKLTSRTIEMMYQMMALRENEEEEEEEDSLE